MMEGILRDGSYLTLHEMSAVLIAILNNKVY